MTEIAQEGVVYAFFAAPFLMFAALAGISTGASILQREQQRKMADEAQKQANYNAELEKIQNEEKTRSQLQQSEQLQKQQRLRRAAIESMYARSGVPLTGTPAVLMEQQAITDAQNVGNLRNTINTDAARGRYNEQMIRYGGRVRADNMRFNADINLLSGFIDTFSSGYRLNSIHQMKAAVPSTTSSTSATGMKLPTKSPKSKLFGLF